MTYNIRPAHRIDDIKEYYFSRKLREVARLNAEGKDIISLGIGGPDMPPAPEVIEALTLGASRADAHSYQIHIGLPSLREAYARWYRKYYGVILNPETEIRPLIGSKEGILHISLAFLNPGDGVLVPNPGYPTYTSVSKIVGAKIFTYDLEETNGWQPRIEQLEQLPLGQIKLMWLNYPHMPTGAPAQRKTLESIIDFCRRHGIVVAHDNPYSFILNDNPESILSIDGARDIAIELNSLSKSHNMAGWRMAMVASNPQFIEWILKIKSNIDSGQFKPVMEAAVEALNQDEDWYKNLNCNYRSRRQIAEQIMHTIGCSFDSSQQGLFLWGKVPENYTDGESLADHLLYDAGVFVTPGSVFGTNGKKYIRISLCATEAKLNEALSRIKKLITNRI